MGRDNSLGTSDHSATPPNYTGGSKDFGVIRNQDGHIPGKIGREGANVHMPNSSETDPGPLEIGDDEGY